MQVTETNSEGLRRELKVVIGASELHERMEAKLVELKDKVQLKGFRPGKVPVEHIRKTYGRSIMAEVVQQAVTETTQSAVKERNERPAMQPDVKLPESRDEVEAVMSGKSDLEFVMSYEVLPKIELKELKSIKLDREVAEISAENVEKNLAEIRRANARFETRDGAAETGDRLTIDFKGFIDGEAFEGGSAEDAFIVLGERRFIPGFEEGIMGAAAGDERVVDVTFPEDYGAAHLAGKPARFEIRVKEVARPVIPEADDEFAKSLGVETAEKLREAVKARIQREYDQASRNKLKKALLDALDEAHRFELPPSLVANEFEAIWGETQEQLKRGGRSFEDEGTTEEKARAEYQELAERRVRLGLVLSEIGQRNEIKLTDEDIKRVMFDRARQFPGQEQQVIEFYRKNPEAVAELRAPAYEDKVVNFVLELAKISDKMVTPAELLRLTPDQGHDHDHECGPDCGHDHHHDRDHGHDHGHETTSAKGKPKKSGKGK